MSSPVGLFSLINLFQLYILLPKLPPYFPPRVGNFILGLDFSILAFNYFSWRDMPLLEQVYDEVSFNQNSHYLEIIGLESGSAFINHLPTSLFIIVVGALHLAVSIIYLILKKSWKFSLCELFIEKVFRCMTLNLYIRIIIEGSLLLFLAIMSEFEQFQESNFFSIFLTICMTIGIGVFLLFMIVWHRFGCHNEASQFHNSWMIFELHSGIRKTNSAKLYNIFYMLVRLVLVGIVILLSSSDEPKHITLQGADLWVYYIEFLLFFIVNIICSAYLIFCWPFKTRANNIIECCNQVCYTLIIVPLLFSKSESDWSKTGQDLYVFGLLTPTILSILVSLLYLLTLIIEKCLKYPKKKVVNARSKDYLKEESKVSGLSKSRLEKPATKISDAELRNAAREFHISRAINKRKGTED